MQNKKIFIYGWLLGLLVMAGQVSAAQNFSKNKDAQALCAALQANKDFSVSKQLPAVPDDYFPDTFTDMEKRAFELYRGLKNVGTIPVPDDCTSDGQPLSKGEVFDKLCTAIENALIPFSLTDEQKRTRTRKLSLEKGFWNDKYQRNEISLLVDKEAERLKRWQAAREKAWDSEQGYPENLRTLLQAFKSLDRTEQQRVRDFEHSLRAS